jgi:hypothetical protein
MTRLIAPAVVTAFKICMKDYETLGTIDDFFMDLGFGFDAVAEADEQQRSSSSRRARAAGYLGTLDLTRGGDARKLLNAIAIKLSDWEHANEQGTDLDRLRRALEINRISWDGQRLIPADAMAVDVAATLRRSLSSEAVAEEVQRIVSNIDSDPAAAITASRALVEASCKAVLERLGQPINDKDELPALYKKAAAALRLDPVQHEQAIYKQTLQGMVSTVQGLAEVRNALGSAHGKQAKAVRPAPRHARLAAGAAWTVATYLAETLVDRLAQPAGDAPEA